jgi:hypothetical protein
VHAKVVRGSIDRNRGMTAQIQLDKKSAKPVR